MISIKKVKNESSNNYLGDSLWNFAISNKEQACNISMAANIRLFFCTMSIIYMEQAKSVYRIKEHINACDIELLGLYYDYFNLEREQLENSLESYQKNNSSGFKVISQYSIAKEFLNPEDHATQADIHWNIGLNFIAMADIFVKDDASLNALDEAIKNFKMARNFYENAKEKESVDKCNSKIADVVAKKDIFSAALILLRISSEQLVSNGMFSVPKTATESDNDELISNIKNT